MAVLAAPVTDEKGARIGVVEALVSWQPIVREFQDEARREVRATLVDRRGRILFPPATAGRATRPSLDARRGLRPLPGAADPLGDDPVRQPCSPRSRPWATRPGACWSSATATLAFASVDRMVRDTVVWSAVCLAGALLLGLIFARRLSRPIAQLAESTRAVSAGRVRHERRGRPGRPRSPTSPRTSTG